MLYLPLYTLHNNFNVCAALILNNDSEYQQLLLIILKSVFLELTYQLTKPYNEFTNMSVSFI